MVWVPFWSRMLHNGSESTDFMASIMGALVSRLGAIASRGIERFLDRILAAENHGGRIHEANTIPVLASG